MRRRVMIMDTLGNSIYATAVFWDWTRYLDFYEKKDIHYRF